MSASVLEVEKLEVNFKIGKKEVTAISDVSFKIQKGITLGIVGESGCGKSVTATSIMGLLPKGISKISNGKIVLGGKELTSMSDKEIRGIRGKDVSMIFQEPMTSLNPVYTIGKQIIETIRAHNKKISKKEAFNYGVEMLDKVGIPAAQQRMYEYPHQLSGGMRQRVMIAMALSSKPLLLIADEPTTALDVTIQAQILSLLQELKDETDTAIMLITHDMGVIAEVADYVMVMYAGQVVEYNSLNELFENPKHPYTRGLLKSIPRLDEETEELYTINGVVPSLDEMPKGCRFCTRCNEAKSICFDENPGLISVGEGNVRCWKYRPNGGEINEC